MDQQNSNPAHKRLLFLIDIQPQELGLSELGLFLYDLASLYELIRLGLDSQYSDYIFGKYPLLRGRRPLKKEDRLLVDFVGQQSQIQIAASIKADCLASVLFGTAYVITREILSIYNLPDGKDLEAKIRRLEEQEAVSSGNKESIPADYAALCSGLEKRGAYRHIQTVLRRLRRSPVRIAQFKIELRK